MRSFSPTVRLFLIVLLTVATPGAAAAAPPSKALDAYVNAYTSMGKAAALMFANNNTRADAQAKTITTWSDAQVKLITAQAAWITAVANANATNATTLQTLEQVRGLRLDNKLKTAKTYYEKRKLYDGYRGVNTRKRPSTEDLLRYSKASLPKRPANYQVQPVGGKVYWPEVLQQDEFCEYRAELDCLFAQRKAGDSAPGSDVSRQVRKLAGEMHQQLRAKVRQTDPSEYLTARKFIDSLAFEVRFPARLEGMAAK